MIRFYPILSTLDDNSLRVSNNGFITLKIVKELFEKCNQIRWNVFSLINLATETINRWRNSSCLISLARKWSSSNKILQKFESTANNASVSTVLVMGCWVCWRKWKPDPNWWLQDIVYWWSYYFTVEWILLQVSYLQEKWSNLSY